MEISYPRLIVDLGALRHNAELVVRLCADRGIHVAGVVKGADGIPECAQAFRDGGCEMIASSRVSQLKRIRSAGVEGPTLLIRIPMASQADEVVETADYSLNSDLDVLSALDCAAGKRGKIHNVILMADMGDLREGFWGEEDLIDAARRVEDGMPNLHLAGVGMNVGCYGSILATREKLQEFADRAEAVEKALGRELEIVSGGATSSFMRVLDGNIPEKINHLRIGEQILLARDLDVFYGYDISQFRQDVFRLEAEVLEVKDKPSYPVGTITIDAFGHKPEYVDRGIRRRALLGVGKADYGDWKDIFPELEGADIIGASSDHTILDVQDAEKPVKSGDILGFRLDYGSLLYLSMGEDVKTVFR